MGTMQTTIGQLMYVSDDEHLAHPLDFRNKESLNRESLLAHLFEDE